MGTIGFTFAVPMPQMLKPGRDLPGLVSLFALHSGWLLDLRPLLRNRSTFRLEELGMEPPSRFFLRIEMSCSASRSVTDSPVF